MVEARFTCNSNTPTGVEGNASINLHAAYNLGKGNEDWSKYTPSGSIQMLITNPGAIEQFKIGKLYKVTFEEVEE